MDEVINSKKIETKRDKFITSALSVKDIFLKEKVTLTFNNYKKTISEFLELDNLSLDSTYSLIIDLNLWYQYFSELEGLSESILLKKQNMKLYLLAFPATPKNVENLNRLNSEIFKIKHFMKQLKIQRKLFNNISWIASENYNNTINNYLYRY